jgi:hypothetical protein
LLLLPLVAAADAAIIIVDVEVIDVVVVVTPLRIVIQCNRMLLSFR